MKAVVGLATSILASCALIGCTSAPSSPPSPSPSPSLSPSSSAWPERRCQDLAGTVGAALQRVVDSYDDRLASPAPSPTPTLTATPSATPTATAPPAEGDEIQDALAEVRDAVEERRCSAAQMRADVDAGIDAVRAESPLAEAVRARLVAGLDGRIPELPVRRAVFPDEDLATALAEVPSGSTLLLSEGTFTLAQPLVILSAVTLLGEGEEATVLTSAAPEAAILIATAEPVTLDSLTLNRDPAVPGSGVVAGGAATLALAHVTVSGGRPDNTGGGAGIMLVGGDSEAERRTTFEATEVTLRDNAWAGLAVAGAHRVSVTDVDLIGNGECGVCFLGASDGSLSGGIFSGNTVGIAVAESARPTLLDLRIDGGEVGLQVEGAAAPVVEGATIAGSSRAAVIVGGTATGALARVVCTDVEFGIVVTDTAAPTLTDNECALARGRTGSESPSPTPGG